MNGSEHASIDGIRPANANTLPFRIGSAVNGIEIFSGAIDDVQLVTFDPAANTGRREAVLELESNAAGEVPEIALVGRVIVEGLFAHYRLDENVTPLKDFARDITGVEPNDSFGQATDTGLTAGQFGVVAATGNSGDGPYAPVANGGDGSGDFDFYRVEALANQVLFVDVDAEATGSEHDPVEKAPIPARCSTIPRPRISTSERRSSTKCRLSDWRGPWTIFSSTIGPYLWKK
ncbi:MAG TPA: hypothetical protein VMN36_03765 [Verrucomicrobiales bacterium]|nr:hypothetical protein [Verrucomicrobiales bacterium]